MNVDQAQRLHDNRRRSNPDHDQVGCWCCCWDCDFDFVSVMDQTTVEVRANDSPRMAAPGRPPKEES